MKRLLIFTSISMIISLQAFSQAYETTITYDKKKQKAIAIDYAYSQEAVQNAITNRIQKDGHTAKEEKGLFNKDKGFILIKNAFLSEISDDKLDYIWKVDRKSRRDKDESTLYLVINRNGEDVINNMSGDDIRKVKSFMNELAPEIEEANLELDIRSQDEVVIKSEKKYKDLQEEKTELEQKLKKNQEAIEAQEKHIETQRSALELLKTKRKTAN
jgi:hypothetical protein